MKEALNKLYSLRKQWEIKRNSAVNKQVRGIVKYSKEVDKIDHILIGINLTINELGGGDLLVEQSDTCTEWCPNCESEVELPYEFKTHKCPNCNERILPCAQCFISNCQYCPL